MMSTVIVSFFTEAMITSRTRRCSFAAVAPDSLRRSITAQMRNHEKFACYRGDDGVVVALDKNGICVKV